MTPQPHTLDQNDTTLLPGAPALSRYLEEVVSGTLTVEGPVVLDKSYGIDYAKQWTLFLDGKELGTYRTFGPKPGETGCTREYAGRIPGYVNGGILIHNSHSDRPIPTDTVGLSYANERFVAQHFHEGPGEIVRTPWQRQDGHNKIPFP